MPLGTRNKKISQTKGIPVMNTNLSTNIGKLGKKLIFH